MPLIRTSLLLFSFFFCSLAIVSKAVATENLWYTVQAGSYLSQKDAKNSYQALYNKLSPQYRSSLRIEYVSSYYTVRAGKSESSQEILPLFKMIQMISDHQPLIIYAYVRPSRILWPVQDIISIDNSTLLDFPRSSQQQEKSTHTAKTSENPKQTTPPSRETLFYTLQAGSFLKQDDAIRLYKKLSQKLPSEMLDSLRIEKIGSFFTVRVGKKLNRQEIAPLLQEAKKVVEDPAIIHAYVRDSRIVRFFPLTQQLREVITPSATITTKSLPQKDVITSKTLPIHQESLEITVPHKTEATPVAPTARAKTRETNEEENDVAAAQAKPTLSAKDYEKMLLSKYLDTSHQTKDRAEANKKAALFTTSPTCTTSSCHAAIQETTLAHFPVKQAKCLACHKQLTKQHPSDADQDFQLILKGASLCQQCHLAILQGKVSHPPADEGDCLQCHAPHGSGNPFLLPVSREEEQKLCMKCHDKSITDHRYQHGPVGLGQCTFCHTPHSADYKALLREEPKKLCINCHDEFKKGLQESPHIHTPVLKNDCQTCHAVHGSSFPNLLIEDPHVFCFSCHPDIQKKFSKSRSKHAGLYLDKQCGTCHLAHFSSDSALLIKSEKELCLACHGNNSPLESYSPKNIEQEISNKEYLHSPISEGNCSPCHDPHGSQFDNLLIDRYPSSFYAPYDPKSYNLCFTCHDRELLTSKITEDGTLFRNGSNNLHYVHVSIEKKGRTCNACHDAHASDGPKLINRTGAKFGDWTMSIDFNVTETGGSCMPGCHSKMKYDRNTAVSNFSKNTTFEKYYLDYQGQ